MSRRLIASLCVMLFGSTAAMAQTAAPADDAPSSGRVFCEQHVSYRLADPAGVPTHLRRFLGVWSDAAWDANICGALIVQDIKADGAAAIIYVYGPLGSSRSAPGGILHGTGTIRGDELQFQNSDGSQFAFHAGIVDLEGHMTTPKGQTFDATFKQTP